MSRVLRTCETATAARNEKRAPAAAGTAPESTPPVSNAPPLAAPAAGSSSVEESVGPSPRASARGDGRRAGPAPLAGSSPARRQAALILEVLAGVRRPSEAAQALQTSLPRYYQLERRALLGLLAACEPSPRGPRVDPTRQLAALERENRRLKRECDRQQALVRMAGRALGLPPAAGSAKEVAVKATRTATKSNGSAARSEPPATATKKRRVRRPSVRALTMIRGLTDDGASSIDGPPDSVATDSAADATTPLYKDKFP